jgi:DNA repair protein RecO (recombination protein O)
MDRFVEESVVLGTVDYGDADRLVTLFTRGRGKLTAFAAGARKSKRRFAGALDPMTLVRAQLVSRAGTTFRLDSVDIDKTFQSIRLDLSRISRGLYAVELARELIRDEQPHEELFSLLVGYLELLEANKAGPTSLIAFELSALQFAGFMPRFDVCAICGGGLADPLKFDPAHGGVICSLCQARSPYGLPVAASLVTGLLAIQRGERKPLEAGERRKARDLLNHFIAAQLGQKLKSVDFMAQVGLD